MSIEPVQTGPDLLTLEIYGALAQPDFARAHHRATELLVENGPIRLLVDAVSLTAFATDGDWGDLSFRVGDRLIAKMAIVADPKRKDGLLMFAGKGLRGFPIEFFAPRLAVGAGMA